jgi:mono/diheme cytochrome c family protein
MNTSCVVMVSMLPLVVLNPLRRYDAAIPYRTQCASCHGVKGTGRPGVNAPPLKDTKLTIDQIVEQLTKGKSGSKPPHDKGMPELNHQQAEAVAEYIKAFK